MKGKGGGWTGRTWRYSHKSEKDAIHYQWRETREKPAFTFTAEAEREIRRAFPRGFPELERAAFLRRVAGALAKVESDKGEPATDPRAARDRAEKVAAMLAEAVSEIGKMTETERDVFDLATSGDPVALDDIRAALEKAAMGFRRAAEGHALQRGEKLAGPDAVALYVAAQAAAAWRETFGREPVEHDGADFVTVLQAILYNAGLPELGVDAIRSAIKGPPKRRKSR